MVRLLALVLCCAALLAQEPPADNGYKLFPGDLVRIEVYNHPDLLIETRIASEGEIAFPLIGSIRNVPGRTLANLEAEIARRLGDGYIRSPSVVTSLREFGPRQASVVGAVKNSGNIPLDPLRPTTVQQAIGAAGGFSDDADQGSAMLVRDDPKNPGSKETIAVAGQAGGADLTLVHGDMVIIPRADRVFVLGQVQMPRAVSIPAHEHITVSKAISLAGGFGRYAKDSKVQLMRRGEAPRQVDVRAVLDGTAAEDPELRAGDTIFVPESRF